MAAWQLPIPTASTTKAGRAELKEASALRTRGASAQVVAMARLDRLERLQEDGLAALKEAVAFLAQ